MPKKKNTHAGEKSLSPFGQDVYEFVHRLKGADAPVNTLIWDATGIDMSNLTKYLYGKKKPDLETVMRIVTAIHPGTDMATKMIHAAGYDISDLRIKGNREYQQLLIEKSVDKIRELYYSATGSDRYNPKNEEYFPVSHLI